jgi:hypothetical protein
MFGRTDIEFTTEAVPRREPEAESAAGKYACLVLFSSYPVARIVSDNRLETVTKMTNKTTSKHVTI